MMPHQYGNAHSGVLSPHHSIAFVQHVFFGSCLSISSNGLSHVFWLTTTWGPLTTTISGFILSYTRLQPWLNRVCRGCNYLITRGAPSCNTVECFYFADLARPNEPNSKTPMPIRDALIACKHEWTQNICRFFFSVSHQKSIIQCHCFAKPRHSISSA